MSTPQQPAPTQPTVPPNPTQQHQTRVYIGRYHQAPPDTPVHVGADGRPYYIPDEKRQPQQQQQPAAPTPQQQEQNEYAERYAHTIAALKEQLAAYTREIQQHLQSADSEPVDADHLRDLNNRVQQLQQELQVAESNYDQASQGQQPQMVTAPTPPEQSDQPQQG